MKFIDLDTQYKRIKSKVLKRLESVLESGQYIMGSEVKEIEDRLSQFVNSKYCLTCSSGTDALLMSLMVLDVKPGDVVLTTPFSYIATSESIRLLGAIPKFIDIDPKTLNMDLEKLEKELVSQNYKTNNIKGIISVNIFGLCNDYDHLNYISKKYRLFVLEDAAQSFGASYKNDKSCSFGHISATSFFPAKPLGCYGDGGAVFTENKDFFDKLYSIRVHGQGKDKYDNIRLGINGRLDTIQAAVLLEKMKIFEDELIKKQNIADYYKKKLNGYVKFQEVKKNFFSSYAQFPILLSHKEQKENIKQGLIINNIPVNEFYKVPLHLQSANLDLNYNKGDLPVVEHVSERILTLPMHPYLAKEDIENITNNIINYL